MKFISTILLLGAAGSLAAFAQPALTIYNQNFAVVRDAVPLDLQSGVNTIRYTDATAQVEPDSVILRDSSGKHSLLILEQNYRNDPVSQELLLSLFEGKTIDFENTARRTTRKRAKSFPEKSSAAATFPAARRSSRLSKWTASYSFNCPECRCFPILVTTRF